ncbi:MAG: TonB-dependent receptor [Muribaculaceae bacterium]|nr:TonB-dependent receptor [Muribaculaceae bacterium]
MKTKIILLASMMAGALGVAGQQPDSLRVGLSEVSVTAIKQASSLLRQPVTVTTISAKEIERYNISGMKAVSEIAPNFFMPDYGSRMTSSIYVRGIGARIDQPAVGLNVDNIPYLNKNGYDFEMADIERIEVLRGPQSTLYGRNTVAGLINVYTLSPMRWEGVKVGFQGGSYGFCRLNASVYKRLRQNLGMSLTGYAGHTNGYDNNYFNNTRSGEAEDNSLRWKTVWQPSTRVYVENTLAWANASQHGYPYRWEETGVVNYNDTCFYKRSMLTEGLTVKWNAPHFTLASITSLQLLHDKMVLDQDFLPGSYFNLMQRQHDLGATQEVVIRGSVDHYSWLAGVFAFYKHNNIKAPVTFLTDGIDQIINSQLPGGMKLEFPGDQFTLGSRFRVPSRGIAVYHRSTYSFGPFDVAAGLRYDYESTSLRYYSDLNTQATMYRGNIPLGVKTIDINDTGKLRKQFRELLPSFSLTFNHNNSAFFASVSRGYKAGGFNTQMFSQILQSKMMAVMGTPPEIDVDEVVSYKPETSWNYEIGGHFSVDHGRVYSTFSAFWIDLHDQQVTIFPEGTTTGRMMANAGRTRSLGAEITLRYTPTQRWIFNLSYGFTKAKFRHFNDGRNDLSGKRVPYAPENTLFASATYTLPIKKARVYFTPDVRGVGSVYWDEENLYKQPFYANLGFVAGVTFPQVNFEVWFRNLTNTQFNTFRYESVGNTFFQRGAPFHWGIKASFKLDNFRLQ